MRRTRKTTGAAAGGAQAEVPAPDGPLVDPRVIDPHAVDPHGVDPDLAVPPFIAEQILDPAFALGVLGVRPGDLAGFGYGSAGAFYLAEGVPRGVPPCAVFDPVFVLAATTGAPTAAALADPAAVLQAALAAYVDACRAGRPPSPSAAFDEAFVRATVPSLAAAVEDGRAASALAAWLAAGKPAVGTTASGIDRFPEALPHPWWERERATAAGRGRRRATVARLTEEALQRVRAADPPALVVRVEPGLPELARSGETVTLVAQGFAGSPSGRIIATELLLGGEVVAREPFQAFPRAEAFARATDLVSAHGQLFGGFAVAWTGPAPAVGEHAVTLRLLIRRGEDAADGERTVRLGTLTVQRRAARRRPGAAAPAVAIAMATFEPRADLFAAQIASIRSQTREDWRLAISDESVSQAGRDLVAELARGDPRITVRHGPRRGVVGNFERALRAVDTDAAFVALADQDDRWHPEKLARLVDRMTDGVTLVHGGMRLVDADGVPLAGTRPTVREATPSLAALLAENQVTGAAALLRAEVVRAALPLPRLPGLYHDHWLALVARSLGRVVFEPAVVQDYVQHGGNVVGEEPERDRAAAARLAAERAGFAALPAGVAAERRNGRAPAATVAAEIAAAETALLPAGFAIPPAALLRAVALQALRQRVPSGREITRDGDGLPSEVDLSPQALAALAATLRSAETLAPPGDRLGIAAWLQEGLSAIAAVAADPALPAAVAARHHAKAVAAARSEPGVTSRLG